MRYLFPRESSTSFIPAVRYAAVCASRGFGKSVLAGAAAVTAVDYLQQLDSSVPNKNVNIIAPTYGQVTDIYWPILSTMFNLDKHARKFSEREGFLQFRKNVKLSLWSYEASERMRGSGSFLNILDEVTTWEGRPGLKDSFESIIQPTMTTRWPGNHRALVISTPRGYDYFHDMYSFQDTDPGRWKSFHYSYRDSPYLSAEEIERVKGLVDPIKFAREYEARFEDSGNNVFYCFDRKIHSRSDLLLPDLADGETVHVSIDFNVGVMAATIWAIRGSQMHAIGEFVGHPDTDTLAKKLKSQFPGRQIVAYPDPSGNSRKTSAVVGVTDFSILKSHGIIVCARTSHPTIADSVNAVNRKLKNARGDIEMYLCPRRAPQTIRSLERTAWLETNPNTATIDKREGVEHFSDGVRYITEYLFPVTNHHLTAVRGFSF